MPRHVNFDDPSAAAFQEAEKRRLMRASANLDQVGSPVGPPGTATLPFYYRPLDGENEGGKSRQSATKCRAVTMTIARHPQPCPVQNSSSGVDHRATADSSFRSPRFERIESFENRHDPCRFGVALREFATCGLAVALIRAPGLEAAATAGAQDDARKRAHALWDRIGSALTQRPAAHWLELHAATT